MLSFIPLVVKDRDTLRAEAGVKYFLVQAIASIVVLTVVVAGEVAFKELSGVEGQENLLGWGVGVALAMKLGMAPVHFWFPRIAENLS